MAVKLIAQQAGAQKGWTVGFDPSTKTGYAVLNEQGARVASGVLKYKKGLTGLDRALAIAEAARQVVETYRPEFAAVEGYSYGSNNNLATMVEIGTLLRLEVRRYCPYIDVPPNSLKKFVTGSGAGKKNLILLAVFQRFGISCDTDDEADAIGLAYFCRSFHGMEVSLPKVNLDAVAKVKSEIAALNCKKSPKTV